MKTGNYDLPILMEPSLVASSLADIKTVTRRIAKARHYPSLLEPGQWSDSYILDEGNRDWLMKDCRYGIVGGHLYVRETCQILGHWIEGEKSLSGKQTWSFIEHQSHQVRYEGAYEVSPKDRTKLGFYKRPSIHVPRWASRLLLEVTSIRLERLHDISEEGAIAEGIRYNSLYNEWGGVEVHPASTPVVPQWRWYETAKKAFEYLWISINGALSWDANPFVWVVEFRRIVQ